MNFALTFLLFKVFLCSIETIVEKSGIVELKTRLIKPMKALFDFDEIFFTFKNSNNTKEELCKKEIKASKITLNYQYSFFEVKPDQFDSLLNKISEDECSIGILGTRYLEDGSIENRRFHSARRVSPQKKDSYFLISEDFSKDFAKNFFENHLKRSVENLGEYFKGDNEKVIKELSEKLKDKSLAKIKKIYEYLQNNYRKILCLSYDAFFDVDFDFSTPENIELLKRHLEWLHELNLIANALKYLKDVYLFERLQTLPEIHLIKIICIPGSFFSFKKNNIDLTTFELENYVIVGIDNKGEEKLLPPFKCILYSDRIFISEEDMVEKGIKSIALKEKSTVLNTSN